MKLNARHHMRDKCWLFPCVSFDDPFNGVNLLSFILSDEFRIELLFEESRTGRQESAFLQLKLIRYTNRKKTKQLVVLNTR